ncbi:MAG: hypothetical protein LBT46_15535 [Planctomycetaceae bacterium]|nr:hypothetical protein [Planctomycetaceae bacterium]
MEKDITNHLRSVAVNAFQNWGERSRRQKNRLKFLRENGVNALSQKDLQNWISTNGGSLTDVNVDGKTLTSAINISQKDINSLSDKDAQFISDTLTKEFGFPISLKITDE